MKPYLGKQRQDATRGVATHGTVLHLVRRVEGVGHKQYMDNYFSPPSLFKDLHQRKINWCGTVRYTRKGMPPYFSPRVLKLKRGEISVQAKGNLTAAMLSNIHPSPAQGQLLDESGR
jgi:hypothetical protein